MKRLGKIKTLAAASLAAFAVAVPVALAQTGGQEGTERPRAERRGGRDGHRGGRGGGFGRGFGFRGIELTDDQKTRLQALRESFGERTRPLREQLRAKHQELRAAQEGNTFNEALAAQKLSEAAAIQARLMGEEFRLRQESLGVLTAEQRTQLDQQRNERKQRREQRRNRGEARGTTEMF